MKSMAKWYGALAVSMSVLFALVMVTTTFAGMASPVEPKAYAPAATPQVTKAGQGFLRVAMQDDMKTTNTVIAQDVWDWNVLGWLMDGPVNRDKITRKPFPWMAENWTYDPADPLHAQMTLKPGIFWTDHDYDTYGDAYTDDSPYVPARDSVPTDDDPAGFREVTAYDVVFSFNLIKDAPRYQNGVDVLRIDTKGNADPSDDVLGVTAVDRYTIQYTLIKPTSDLVMEILAYSIWPQHIWSAHTGDKLTWQPEVNEVVFSGMFILDTWDKGNMVKLVRNEHYFNKSAIPNVDGIIFKIYGTTDLAILALQSDEVDFIAWAITPGYIPTIQENNELALAQTKEMGFFYASYNFRNKAFGYDDFSSANRRDIGKPLRQAIAHCINKEEIVLKLLQGKGTVGDSAVSPANAAYYNQSVRIYSFDPDQAKAVLDAAGYYKSGQWYVAPDGSPIDGPGGDGIIELIHPPADYDPIRAEAGRMIAEQMTAVGIRAESKPVDFGTLVSKTNNHDFEMFLLGWSIGGEDAGYMADFFRTDPADTIGGYNSQGYRNESYDVIVDAMMSELDVDKRIALAKRAQGIIAEDLAYNILYYRDNIEAYRISNFKSGWWEQTGGLFNQWTLMDLSTQATVPMTVTISGPAKLNAPAVYTVSAVNALTGAPISGATVNIAKLYDHGTVTPATGTTDTAGRMTFTFSPEVVAVDTAETFVANVVYETTEKAGTLSVLIKAPGAFWLETSSEITDLMPMDYDEARTTGVAFDVRVKDPADGWISGATVDVSVGAGTFDADSKSTNADGLAQFVFTPPADQAGNLEYAILAHISYLNPNDGQTYTETEELSAEILVVAKDLRVKMLLDVQSPAVGDTVTVTVTVTDTSSLPISGATVELVSNPTTTTIAPAQATTNSQGKAVFTLTADDDTSYVLTATASKDKYKDNTARVTLTVKADDDDDETPAVGLVGGMAVLALVALAVVVLRKRLQ